MLMTILVTWVLMSIIFAWAWGRMMDHVQPLEM